MNVDAIQIMQKWCVTIISKEKVNQVQDGIYLEVSDTMERMDFPPPNLFLILHKVKTIEQFTKVSSFFFAFEVQGK